MMFVKMYEDQKNQIDQDMAPFGFIDNGIDEDVQVDNEGSVWYITQDGKGSYSDSYPK